MHPFSLVPVYNETTATSQLFTWQKLLSLKLKMSSVAVHGAISGFAHGETAGVIFSKLEIAVSSQQKRYFSLPGNFNSL